ncbi:MAG TPA: hypothetical protein VHV32_04970, partial [Candidatus Angelobacter sp.]|nr:hypothetical protein [Candidatus Angelobacter sp.]
MELEPTFNAGPSKLTLILYNDRGLRAGWRLLIYCGMIFVLILGGGAIAKRLSSGQPKALPSSDFTRTVFQAIAECVLFLVLLFLAW